MKRTDMMVCVGKRNGYDVWRVVFTTGGHFYVKWKKQLICVDKDIDEHNFSSHSLW